MSEYWKYFLFYLAVQRFVITNQILPKHQDDNELLTDEVPACGAHGVCDCSHMFKVVCTGRKLTRLPTGIPRNISYLYLNENFISIVPTLWMLQFQNLYFLDISSNQIKQSFRLPKNLLKLHAGDNLIESIEEFFWNGCGSLREVHLGDNKIKEIPEKTFQTGCKLLGCIRLEGNNITELRNDTLKGLTGMLYIKLGPNPIHRIDGGAFSDICHSVRSMIVKRILLRTIPQGLFKGCAKLNELYWTRGALETIANGIFSGIKSLDIIDLSMNDQLSELPQGMFAEISWVRFMSLTNINITEVPEDLFKKVKIVSKVDLGYNRITMVPDSLFSAEKDTITVLILAHNKLTQLSPKFFQNLPYLMHLYLFANNLIQLTSDVFFGTNLQTLYIFDNNITEIQDRPFRTKGQFPPLLINLRNNPISMVSGNSLLDLAPNASVILECGRLTLPLRKVENITIKCVTPEVQLEIKGVGIFAIHSFQYGGFTCNPRNLSCESCPVGSYTSSLEAGCIQCPAGGFYQDMVGSYTAELGGIGCKSCNPGTFVIHGSGTSPLSCKVCPEGTRREETAGFRACYCLENHFRLDRFGKCFPCPNEGISCANDTASIAPGYFWKWNSEDFKAYEKYVININTRSDEYNRASKVYNGPLPMAHKCLIPHNCVNNGNSLAGNCKEGYQGWLCSVCAEGYFQLFQLCHRCNSFWTLLGEILLFLFVTALFLWFIISPFVRRSRVAKMSRDRSSGDVVMSRVKILIGFYQVVDSYWHMLSFHEPSSLMQFIVSRIIEVMSFALSLIFVSPGCFISWFRWNPYTQLWAFYGLLSSLTLIFLQGYCITLCVLKQRKGDASTFLKVRSTCLKLLVFTFFVSYSEACSLVFQLYNCDKFYLDQDKTVDINLLHSNYNISCDTELYMLYRRVYCLPGWILICSFPLIMFLFLFKYSRTSRGQNSVMPTGAYYPDWLYFMCENLKSNCWYWEIVELGRKVLLTFLPLAFGWEGVNIILGLFASVIFLSLHVYTRPMKDSWDNFLQFLSLLFLIFNMLVSAYNIEGDSSFVYVIVALINIALLLLVSVDALIKMFTVCKKACLSIKSSAPEQQIQASTCSYDETDETIPLCQGGTRDDVEQENETHFIEKDGSRNVQTVPSLSCQF
ncbi:Insulin-like growth factor-binding protein complex acid labile subunit [Holothuria leucospilota]|uniref:Insulin-like growth factor-binding protein complex acid labile subunit n=1 Tax=Holothuria leucospilota TaxID=206669 RepID=A0A9Q1CC03_HOLLE|nr:Insulin-like growth factor-binding protein complex acid labile subunit [Holothuria leucospilota]